MIRKCLLIVLLASFSQNVHAVIWTYSSTDGTTTVSGQLTTTGSLPLVDGMDYSVTSIDTVILNAVDITASSNWENNLGLPFTDIAAPPTNGSIRWDASTMLGTIPVTDDQVFAFESTLVGNGVQLARPSSGNSTEVFFNSSGSTHASFMPTSTTFTAIPEPSPFALLLIVLGGTGLVRFVRHRKT